jgi:hypothetical protein
MISEEVETPEVEVAPFGIFSPAVTVKNVEMFSGTLLQQQGTIVSSKVADWDVIDDFDSAVSVYTSNVSDIYTEGYSFHVYLKADYSTLNLAFESELEKAFNQVEQAALQQAIETQIWSILEDSSDKQEANTAGVKVRYGFAQVEGLFGNKSFGEKGLIHAPRSIASAYRGKAQDGVLYSSIGTPIIAGTGYPTDAGKVYMTGPITIYITDYISSFEVDRSANTVQAFRDYPIVVSIMDKPFVAQIDLSMDYS